MSSVNGGLKAARAPVKPTSFRFTDSYLQRLKVPPGKRELIQFEPNTGLGIRTSALQISFIVQLRLKDGRRWRETLGPYGKLTVEAARTAVQAIAGDIAKGIDPFLSRAEAIKVTRLAEEVKRFTLRALVERWRRDHLSERRMSYARRAVAGVTRNFASLLDQPAAALTKADVKAAIEATREASGPAAARFAAATLRAALRWALSEDLLAVDPLNGFKPPPHTTGRERVLKDGELRRIWEAAGRLRYPGGPFVKLLLLTGARRHEIAGLRWDEISEAEGGKAIELPSARTKTGAGHRIPLTAAAVQVLSTCPRVVGCSYVFSSDGWRALNNFDRVKKAIDEEIAKSGPPILDWTFHDFRRSLVSTLASEDFDFDPVVLDMLLGHVPSKLSSIARIYQKHQFAGTRRGALEAWAGHVTQVPASVSRLPASKGEKAGKRRRG